jgi:GNAT superfamily N-acetyltransferase
MAITTERYTIEEVDLSRADDRLVREVADLANAVTSERVPEDPPLSYEGFASRFRSRPQSMKIRDFVARTPEGELVARGSVIRYEADTNQDHREAVIEVLAAHRRRGVAKRLLREVVKAAGEGDDLVIGFYTSDRIPAGAAFLQRVGAKQTLTMHTNQLDLSSVDREMVREWASINPDGYRLEWIDGDVPERLVNNVIVAYDCMNTAPRGESSMEDWHTTAEQLRDWDRSRNARGGERRLLLAIHEITGATAGYTELAYDPKLPPVIWQQGTAVIPAHRGQGIGKWIKAAMLERAMRDWPRAKLVRTGNADSNAPMLAINTKLGFRPAWAGTIWEIGIADLRRYVDSFAESAA